MVDVKGKWVFVTGASRGVGRQIALFMANRGANIILHSRKLEHTEEVFKEVRETGVRAMQIEAELSDMDSVGNMLKRIDDSGLQVDIVFNDAAVQIAYRTDYFKTPVEDFTQSFMINTIAPAMICYHFLPKMIERGFGRIINTTSGIKNEPEQAGYSASKAALDKFTTDLSTVIEGTDVMMNITDPGWCRTDLGGPNAPNSVESCIPGIVVGAFVDDRRSGRLFPAQSFNGLTLIEAVSKAETMY
ncbi:SDR family oxidoreductase [Ruminococcus sp. Marseille-P6503]|uniref:SDR family NAD(P)-dependent oxidoreductase n=1 Tax=Ruminococcus sp. Marseille-P6503 TaxID=2364796 RepID=UPI000F5419AF|nr:SDR family oxidoreductase [Ruminococcus sp. Marseille-P6503]